MTEKRFTNTDNGFIVDYKSEQKVLNLYDVVELLNELSEENEQLRKDATILIQSNQDYRKENEQLKQQNENLLAKLKYTCEQINYSEKLRDMIK